MAERIYPCRNINLLLGRPER